MTSIPMTTYTAVFPPPTLLNPHTFFGHLRLVNVITIKLSNKFTYNIHFCCLNTIWAQSDFFWCYRSILIMTDSPGWIVFIFWFISYLIFLFSILFFPGPSPWKIQHIYLKAYFGVISFPFASRYSSFILSYPCSRSPFGTSSLLLPSYSSRLLRPFSRMNFRAPESPMPILS